MRRYGTCGKTQLEGSPDRFCLITTKPIKLVGEVHDRMPVILQPRFYKTWLEPGAQPAATLEACLLSYPATNMDAYQASQLVNKAAANDNETLIRPAGNIGC